MNDALRTLKKVIMAYFKVLYQHFFRTEENHRTSSEAHQPPGSDLRW